MGPLGGLPELSGQNDQQQAGTLEKAGGPPASGPSASPQSTPSALFVPKGRVSDQEEEELRTRPGNGTTARGNGTLIRT